MDESLTWVGIALILLGVTGIFISYADISRTFVEGLHALSALVLLLGVIMFAGGITKGGFPSVKMSHAAVIGTVIAISSAGLTTAAIIGYGPFELLYPPPPPPAESPIKVHISIIPGSWDPNQPENYVPKHIRVLTGVNNTVIWTNDEELDIAHTVTSEEGVFDSGLFGKGESWKFTFTQAGVYRYYCIPHPWMRGSVTVEEISPEEAKAILEQLGITTVEEQQG